MASSVKHVLYGNGRSKLEPIGRNKRGFEAAGNVTEAHAGKQSCLATI